MSNLHVRTLEIVKPPSRDAVLARVDAVEASLHDQVAALAFKVFDSDATRDRVLPDYFGQAYLMVAQEAFNRFQGQAPGADALMHAFFGLSLLAVKRLGNELSDVENVTVRANYITEPVVNLLELSGYAYLFSQLHGQGEIWQVTRQMWDKALQQKHVNVPAIRLIYDDTFVVMRPWYVLRFNWERVFRGDVAKATSDAAWLSPFIRAIAENVESWHYFDMRARDAFLLVYLRFQSDFADMKLSNRAESLQHTLDRIHDDDATPPDE